MLPEDIRRAVVKAIEPIKKDGTNVRWVSEENLHITLKFLGDSAPDIIPAVKSVLKQTAAKRQPVNVEVDGLGAFPNAARARVVWVGITKGAAELKALSRDIEKSLEHLGFEDENRFKAHITLGRMKRPSDGSLARAIDEGTGCLGVFTASKIDLMKSDLGPAGARYESLASFALGALTDADNSKGTRSLDGQR